MPLDDTDFQMNVLAAVKRLLDEEMVPLQKKLDDQEKAHQETVDGYKSLVVSLRHELDQNKEIISKCVDSVTGLAQIQDKQAESFVTPDMLSKAVAGAYESIDAVEKECASLGGSVKALDLLAEKVDQVEAKIPTIPEPVDLEPLRKEFTGIAEGITKRVDDQGDKLGKIIDATETYEKDIDSLNKGLEDVILSVPKLPDYDELKKSALLDAKEAALKIAQDHIKEPKIGPMGYIKEIKTEVKGRRLHMFMETSSGEIHECEADLPTPEFAGPYKSNKKYPPNAITSHNYALWIATKDATTEPGTSGDWKLMVKAPRGKPGVSVKDFIAVEGGVTAKMSDGEEIFVDVHKA